MQTGAPHQIGRMEASLSRMASRRRVEAGLLIHTTHRQSLVSAAACKPVVLAHILSYLGDAREIPDALTQDADALELGLWPVYVGW